MLICTSPNCVAGRCYLARLIFGEETEIPSGRPRHFNIFVGQRQIGRKRTTGFGVAIIGYRMAWGHIPKFEREEKPDLFVPSAEVPAAGTTFWAADIG